MLSRPEELTAVTSVVRFVLSRIDEDQAEVDRWTRAETRDNTAGTVVPDGLQAHGRLRSELVAKRHVIGELQQLLIMRDLPQEQPMRDVALAAMFAMAQPYHDHPQFQPKWADVQRPWLEVAPPKIHTGEAGNASATDR